jgi:hypothetical protein
MTTPKETRMKMNRREHRPRGQSFGSARSLAGVLLARTAATILAHTIRLLELV